MTAKQTYIVDRVLHWLSVFGIIFLLSDMSARIHYVDYRIKGTVQHKQDAIEIHMAVGLLLLAILLMRLVWTNFFLHEDYKPKYDQKGHRLFAKSVHFLLFSFCFLLMASGFMMVSNYTHPLHFYGLFSLSEGDITRSIFNNANEMHLFLKSSIYALIFIHVAGAVYKRR